MSSIQYFRNEYLDLIAGTAAPTDETPALAGAH
jgi:hypothetical protein